MIAACQYKYCGKPVVVQLGHRPRRYCNNRCKQAEYRRRLDESHEEAKKQAIIEQTMREYEERRKLWPHFGYATQRLLWDVRSRDEALADQITLAIYQEMERALNIRLHGLQDPGPYRNNERGDTPVTKEEQEHSINRNYSGRRVEVTIDDEEEKQS